MTKYMTYEALVAEVEGYRAEAKALGKAEPLVALAPSEFAPNGKGYELVEEYLEGPEYDIGGDNMFVTEEDGKRAILELDLEVLEV